MGEGAMTNNRACLAPTCPTGMNLQENLCKLWQAVQAEVLCRGHTR